MLPLGSFPSQLLHPWAPKELSHESTHTTLPLSTTPAPENEKPQLDLQSPTSKPTPDDGSVKPLTVSSPTTSTLLTGQSKSRMTEPSVFPTPDIDKIESSAELPMSPQAAINRVSRPQASFGVVLSSPDDVPLPEQTEAELDALGPDTDTTFEVAMRALLDPDESSGSNLENLVALVADGLKGRREAKEMKSEIMRLNRQEEDLRHDWMDQREHIEKVINGQNVFTSEKEVESNRLFFENSRLDRENSALKEKLEDQKDGYNREIETLKAGKQFAEDAETKALAEVEDRIGKEKLKAERERLNAQDRHWQEMNSEKCQRYEVNKELALTKNHLRATEENHEAAIKKKDKAINRLRTDLRGVEPALAAAVERETSTKDRLQEELKRQRKEKDGEIGILQAKLRRARDEVRSSKNSSRSLNTAAKLSQLEIERLSSIHDEEKLSLREHNNWIVGDLQREKNGLERTIRDDEAEIDSLKGKICELESGVEIRSLRSRVRTLKKKLQTCQQETEELHKATDAQESRGSEEVQKASHENKSLEDQLADLKNQLAEAARSKEGQDRAIQDYKERNEKLDRDIKATRSAEQTLRAEVQRVRHEKAQIDKKRRDAIREKDKKTHSLQQKEQLEEERRQTTTNYDILLNKKDEEIKKKGEEIVGLQELVKVAQNMELTKNREITEEQEKVAAEKNAKDAADAERMKLQRELDNERQTSQDAQDKATETETKMRNEILTLKSEVRKAEHGQLHDSASNDGKELEALLAQANDANNLLLEIGKNGVVQGSPEHSTLCELNEAKRRMYKANVELRKPHTAASKARLLSLIGGVNVSEERFQQFSSEATLLVEQVRKANARLRRLQKILDADDDVQKEAMLEALNTDIRPERVVRKPQTLKRPGKPGSGILSQPVSTGGQAQSTSDQSRQTLEVPAQLQNPQLSTTHQNLQPRSEAATTLTQTKGHSQAQSSAPANRPAFSSKPQPKKDNRQPFAGLLTSLSPTPAIEVHSAPRQERPAEDQPLNPGGLGDSLPPASPPRLIRSIRGRSPQLVKKDNENQVPRRPVGWTEAMTEDVREANDDDTIEDIDWAVRIVHAFEPQDDKVFKDWIRKLHSDFKAEKNKTKP